MLDRSMPDSLLDSLLARCTFPPAGTSVVCGLSGGADSAALVALAVEAGCRVSAVHVDHGLRDSSADDALAAGRIAERFDVAFDVVAVELEDGPNLEARARAARREALGPGAMTGHTADDQAETLLLALLRGSGAAGLGAIQPGPRHPILALRRSETAGLCRQLGLEVAHDPTNDDPRFRRNRIRHELLPLLDDIAERDMAVLLDRTARLLRDDNRLLEDLAAAIDPTDVDRLLAAPGPLATRALRRWLERDGYPPDAAAVARVLGVAAGTTPACELAGGLRVERQGRRLVLFPAHPSTR
jgi:tRNA(Ile)-lysidine synthase